MGMKMCPGAAKALTWPQNPLSSGKFRDWRKWLMRNLIFPSKRNPAFSSIIKCSKPDLVLLPWGLFSEWLRLVPRRYYSLSTRVSISQMWTPTRSKEMWSSHWFNIWKCTLWLTSPTFNLKIRTEQPTKPDQSSDPWHPAPTDPLCCFTCTEGSSQARPGLCWAFRQCEIWFSSRGVTLVRDMIHSHP